MRPTSSLLALSACSVALVLALTGAARAQTEMAPATAAKPTKTFKVLTPGDVDPARLLSPPPADASARGKDDLAQVERLYRNRTPEQLAHADWDDKHEDSEIFADTLGPAFDLTKLPETARFLKLVENEQSVAANVAKRYFQRMRPWGLDTTIKPCDYKPNANPKTSFPSGHATLGYSVGYVLSDLMPGKAPAIQARAYDYAYSRLICGDHFASDTEASHVLGVTIGVKLMNTPALAAQIAAVRAELKAAGLTD